MSLQKCVISSGRVCDAIKDILMDKGEERIICRPPVRKGEYIMRSFLPSSVADDALIRTGHTVYELFLSVIPNAPELSPEDQELIEGCEQLAEQDKDTLHQIIRSVQAAWWLPHLSPDTPTRDRLFALLNSRCPIVKRSQFFLSNPTLASLVPFRDLSKVDTDMIPALAAELDIAYQWLFRVGETVPVYSRVAQVDQIYMEYKLLNRANQGIVLAYLRAVLARSHSQ